MPISDNLLNKTAIIYVKDQGTADDFGEHSFTLVVSIPILKVAFQPTTQGEVLQFTLGGTTYVAKMVAYCNYREDIYPNNILEVEGQKYQIISVQNDGGRNTHLRIYVTQ